MGAIKEAINKNQVVLLVFNDSMGKTLPKLCGAFVNKGIGIVSSSNPADVVLQKLEDEHVDCSNIFFVDAINGKNNISKNTIYTTRSRGALTELSIIAPKLLDSKNTGMIIFDSISSLLLFNQDIALVRFLHSFVCQVRNTKKKLVLFILSKDLNGSLASIPLFVDAVVEVR